MSQQTPLRGIFTDDAKFGSCDADRFHIRLPYGDHPPKVFAAHLCSEKPDYRLLTGIDREIHFARHFAKKGVYPNNTGQVDPRHSAPDNIVEQRVDAALWAIEKLMTDEHVNKLAEHIKQELGDEKTATIYLLRNAVATDEDIAYNFLSPTYDQVLIKKLSARFASQYPEYDVSFEMETALRINDTKRVYSDEIERLVRQPFFDLEDLEKMRGKKIIIADEHVQAAGLVATINALLRDLGPDTQILGITTLTAHPTTLDLKPSGQVVEGLQKAANLEENGADRLENLLNRVGLSFETISNREALYLLSLLMDGSDPAQETEFSRLYRTASHNIQVVEGIEDNPYKTLIEKPPLSIAEIGKKMSALIAERPKSFYRKLEV